jgi:molecular chaperone DnaJ
VFERRGHDLHAVLDIPMVQAALGTELEVETLDGNERVKIYPGTQSGEVIRLRGRGVPHLGRRGRGDAYLTVHVRTPEGLRREERQMMTRLGEIRGDLPGSGRTVGRLRRPDHR